jgi:hypothetical protein
MLNTDSKGTVSCKTYRNDTQNVVGSFTILRLVSKKESSWQAIIHLNEGVGSQYDSIDSSFW